MGTYQNGQFEDVTATILREREDFLDLRPDQFNLLGHGSGWCKFPENKNKK